VHHEIQTEAPILIVDDDPLNLRLLQIVLESAGYARVHATSEPRRAVSLLTEVQPDLVITDLHMPELDGFELLARLRNVRPSPTELAIVVLTCDSSYEAQQRAVALGATAYLTKPFAPDHLLRCLDNLCPDRE
jgi:putative two-component system response regulator